MASLRVKDTCIICQSLSKKGAGIICHGCIRGRGTASLIYGHARLHSTQSDGMHRKVTLMFCYLGCIMWLIFRFLNPFSESTPASSLHAHGNHITLKALLWPHFDEIRVKQQTAHSFLMHCPRTIR